MAKKGESAGRSWLLIALVVCALLSLYRASPQAQAQAKTQETTLLEFYEAMENGRLVEPVTRVFDRDEGSTYLAGEMELKDELNDDGSPKKRKYRVRLVPGENERVMNDLLDNSIKTEVVEKKAAISPFIVQTLFFVGMLALLYWIMYRRMGGGGPFGFGKSKAKVLNGIEAKNKVTFADVAGVDEAIAGEAKVPFFAMSGSDFEEMFVGVGASRMRDVFSEAKKRAPCIVFIDEIDSIGQKRTGAGAIGGSHAYEQTLNTMLVEMDGFDANEGVIVIAATNRPDTLDSALLRPGRFDRQVVVELPTLKGRREILELHGKKITFAPDADLDRVARGTPGFSGADLANLLNEAALMAVRKKLDGVDMATLDEARDKVLWGRERKSAGYSQKDREYTAWHEAGHAILQVLLPNTDPLHKVTIIPRGRALGATMALPEKDVLNRTKRYFLDEICICCGGRIAEEMKTGDISTGAAQDIQQATAIARDMICTYGMSENYGFQAFVEPSQFSAEPLPPPFSQKTAEGIDAEVKKLVEDAYAKAEKLLRKNRDKLELLATALLEKESMDGRDIETLLGLEKET